MKTIKSILTLAIGLVSIPAFGQLGNLVPYRMDWGADYGAHALTGGEIVHEVGGNGVALAASGVWLPEMYGYAYPYEKKLQGFAAGWPNGWANGRGEMYDTWTVQGEPGYINFFADVTGDLRLRNDLGNYDPALFVSVYYRAELYKRVGEEWVWLAGFEPWPDDVYPVGLVQRNSGEWPVEEHFGQLVYVTPGDRLLTASVLLAQTTTCCLYDPIVNWSGESDFADSAFSTLTAVDPGVVLISAAPIPEPATIALVLIAAALLCVHRALAAKETC